MFRKYLFFILQLVIFTAYLAAEEMPEQEQETLYVERLSQTIDLLEKRHHEVWPGYTVSLNPIVVSFANGHIYAFNLKSVNPTWEKKQVGLNQVLFSQKDLWGVSDVAMQDQFLLDGEEVFAFNVGVMQKLKGQEFLPLLVIIHELFHRYQFNEFNSNYPHGLYQDSDNIQNLALIQLEERVLINFLRASEPEKLEHLKDFIAIHKIRKTVLKRGSINWENYQQSMEGLADYASIKAQDVFQLVPQFSGEAYISTLLEGYARSPDPGEMAAKWRHYGVGSAIAYGLDYLHVPNWKEKVEENAISLADQLEKAVPLSFSETYRRSWAVKHTYEYSSIYDQIAGRALFQKNKMVALLDGYEEQEGVIFVVDRPKDTGINGGGKTCGIYHLPNGSTLSVNDSSVSASTDNLWKVEFKAVPYVFQQGQSRWWKVQEELKITIDGEEYGLQDLLKAKEIKPFTTLSWQGESCNFESLGRSGHLEVMKGQLKIIFDQL